MMHFYSLEGGTHIPVAKGISMKQYVLERTIQDTIGVLLLERRGEDLPRLRICGESSFSLQSIRANRDPMHTTRGDGYLGRE